MNCHTALGVKPGQTGDETAHIGDALSTYRDGVISGVNEGVPLGMQAADAAAAVLQARTAKSRE